MRVPGRGMSEDSAGRHASSTNSFRRRDVLGALGATGALALAGCSSDGADDGGGGEDTDGGGDSTPTEPAATTDASDGGDSETRGGDGRVNCDSPGFAYTTTSFQPSAGPTLQTTVPERASVRTTSGLTVQLDYQNYQSDSIVLTPTYNQSGSVDEGADAVSGAEITAEYDPTVSGTRVFRTSSREGRRRLTVLLPAGEAYFSIRVTIAERACQAGTAAAATAVIDGLQPAG